MNSFIKIVKNTDLMFCRYLQNISQEKPALIVFNFHKIFKSISDIYKSGVDPQQGTTLEEFKIFIEYFLDEGYEFIHPDNIPDKLNNTKKYILITFDDGYYNNSYSLPIINEFRIPAIFFIASNNILNNEVFWWDAVYRLKNNGASTKDILLLKKMIKKMSLNQVKEFLRTELPVDFLRATNDYDRPFNVNELKDFANERYVIIGNHTADHAILTNCSRAEAKNQIEKAQIDLQSITGKIPKFLAYPNGNYSNEIIDIIQKMDVKLAFSTIRRKNFLPIYDKSNLLKLKRFMISRFFNIEKDGILFRSNYSLFNNGINIFNKLNKFQFIQ